MCYSSYAIVGPDGEKVMADYLVPKKVDYYHILKENCMLCSAMLIETEQVRRFMFNTKFFHEDYVLGLELLRAGCVAVGCRELLLDWRYLEKSRSFNKLKSAKNRWKIYREFLELPLHKSVYYFINYTITGFRKYSRKHKRTPYTGDAV